ncbi:MAG: 16S rRNA (cytosine(1402)-N(4))-methyltransferase RsmH [Deltaproteobacteria bacterium]|nr:16S rRNA (cytosine(1402)-N(4))-methyltransferase RsmH [Deltaproteobacteria bacterium]
MSAAFQHITVLRDEVVAALGETPAGWVVDCTLGGGGHSEAMLQARADHSVLGLDRDPDALAAATARLAPFGPRFVARQSTFGALGEVCAERGLSAVAGVVADLGVSSPQLDRPERGFSFREDGPLDMRMDPTSGEPVLELLRRARAEELADVLYHYGDVERSRRLSRIIVEAIGEGVSGTSELAARIARAVPGRPKIHPATRVFQALRIWVNDELGEVERLMAAAPALLHPGGVLAVISFHSGEDRIVKHAMRALAPKDGEFELVTRKSEQPSEAETARNPRARSARLRILRRRHPDDPPRLSRKARRALEEAAA